MTYQTDDIFDEVEEPAEQPRRRALPAIAVFLALVGTGIGSGFLWRAYSDAYPSLSVFSFAREPLPEDEQPIKFKRFKASQQRINETMQSISQALANQQIELKRLSEQVSALSAKIDSFQHSPVSAQASAPMPPKAASPAVRKKPAASKPPDNISVGGAPLPPPVQLGR